MPTNGFRKPGAPLWALLVLVALSLIVPLAGAAPIPLTGDLTISADPNPIVYNHGTNIAGRLRNTNVKAGVLITLQRKPAPYTGEYETADTTTTDTNGRYRFTDVEPLENTRYRVSSTVPEATSKDVIVQVRYQVTLRVKPKLVRRGKRVRFYGTVAPEHDGSLVNIQKRRSLTGRWHTIRKVLLKDAGTEFSSFSTRIRIRRSGTYRAVEFHDATHADGVSRAKRVRAY